MRILIIVFVLLLSACAGKSDHVEPVDGFEIERYLGTWYEIARLDHSFERGLTHVTAEYSMREDGGVRVLNRGYDEESGKWKEAEGKAYFVERPDLGHLKVSFFGPFYGAYIIFDLDHEHYRHALVSGPGMSYLWILARDPEISEELLDDLIAKADAKGFDTERLIFVDHQ